MSRVRSGGRHRTDMDTIFGFSPTVIWADIIGKEA